MPSINLKSIGKKDIPRLVCAGLSIISAISWLIRLIGYANWLVIPVISMLSCLILAISYGVIGFCMITNRRDGILAIGIGGILLKMILNFLDSIFKIEDLLDSLQIKAMGNVEIAEALPSSRGGSVVSGFIGFLGVVATLLALAILLVNITNFVPKVKDVAKKYWYISPAIFAVCAVFSFIFGIFEVIIVNDFYFLMDIGSYIFSLIFYSLLLIGVLDINLAEMLGSAAKRRGSAEGGSIPSGGDGFISLVSHTLLLVFTLGIWNLIWIYKTTMYLNKDEALPKRDPITSLLLCIFIPVYTIYWIYQTARRAVNLLPDKSRAAGTTALITIMYLINPLIGAIITQDVINKGTYTDAEAPSKPSTDSAYYDILTHTLLLFVTFGIWQLIWIYRTTAKLERANARYDDDPTISTILALFVPVYTIFWAYKTANKINKIAAENGKDGIDTCIPTVLAMLAPPISYIIIQDAINNL